jgi:hypothetical protein
MPPVGVVQVAVHQEVHVVAVGDLRVAAARPMHMVLRVAAAGVARRASGGVGRVDRQRVLIDVAFVGVVQVAVVQVIDVAAVLDG